MSIITIILIIFGVLILFGIIMYVYVKKKGSKKHPFLLYSRDGKNVRTIYPKLRTDPSNKNNKKFSFESFGCDLELRTPTKWINDTPFREITHDNKGGLTYINGQEIDDKDYLKTAVSPEERHIVINTYKENQKRFENPMNKLQAYTLLAGFALVFILAIGIVYSVITWVNAADDMVDLIESAEMVARSLNDVSNGLLSVSERQVVITAALTKDYNITRILE